MKKLLIVIVAALIGCSPADTTETKKPAAEITEVTENTVEPETEQLEENPVIKNAEPTEIIAEGDITSVNTGAGLTGGNTAGDINLEIDTTVIQTRVSSECSENEAIRIINQDGTVTCESVITEAIAPVIGPPVWSANGDDIYYNSGNVGIGTMPASILDIMDISPVLTIRATGNTNMDTSTLEFHTNQDTFSDTTRAAIVGGSEGNGNREGYLSLKTRPETGSVVERVRITSAGDIGIGIQEPTTKLDVNGEIKAAAISGPWDQSEDGYIRLGNVQIMWGINSSMETEIIFDPEFSTTPSISILPIESTTTNNVSLVSATENIAEIKWVVFNGTPYTSGYHWTAIGIWQ